MPALWTIAANPRKRRGSKRRSAAQRAATRRMIAANRATRHNPKRRRKARKASAAPAVSRRIRRTRSRSRSVSRRASASMRGIGGGAMGILKAGAIGAGGAIAVDVAQGFVNGFLPVSMNSKINADGTTNYLNYAVKGALAVGLAHFGGKVVSSETAKRMAVGSMTVMAYELLRPFAASVLPASMSLGWYSPGMTFKAGSQSGLAPGMGRYQSLGRYQNVTNVSRIKSPNAVVANTR